MDSDPDSGTGAKKRGGSGRGEARPPARYAQPDQGGRHVMSGGGRGSGGDMTAVMSNIIKKNVLQNQLEEFLESGPLACVPSLVSPDA